MTQSNFPTDDELSIELDGYEPPELPVEVPPFNPAKLSRYEAEKLVGIRNKSGHTPIKNFKPKHKKVLALHVIGRSTAEIANETEYSVVRVAQIIRAEASQQYLAELAEAYDSELKSLMPLAVMAVREALLSDSISTRLSGVDRFIKLSTMGQPNGNGNDKGGDVYNTLVVNSAREKFVNELKVISGLENVVDLKPEKEEDIT